MHAGSPPPMRPFTHCEGDSRSIRSVILRFVTNTLCSFCQPLERSKRESHAPHEHHLFPGRKAVAINVRGGRTLTLATVGALAASLLAVGGVATASSAASEVYACVHK